MGQGIVGVIFQWYDSASPESSIGSNHYFGFGVVESVSKGFGAEPTEDNAMGGTDAGASQHGYGQLRHHRKVNGDPVTLFHSQAF